MRNQNFGRSGVWFYGLAGSGKTYASTEIAKVKQNPFVIDGDQVRRFISFDLGYSAEDRLTQLSRMYGIAKLAISNNYFPIVSTVTMSKKILDSCTELAIEVVQIQRSFEVIKSLRAIYQSGSNVVGVDAKLEDLDTPSVFNNGTAQFVNEILQYAE